MVVTHTRANKQMEEELAAIKSKLEDLDQKFLGLHLQHSPMNNRHQPESSADTGFQSSSNFHGSKLVSPRFNCDDPTGWIHKEEQYFNRHNNFDITKVPLASFHLEREALQWLCWYNIKDHEEPQWTDFFQLLLHQFGPIGFDEFIGALTKLLQTGTVREYQTEFEKLVKHTEGFSDAFYMIFFYQWS